MRRSSGGRGGTWNKDDLIVYGTNGGGLFRVPAAGGTPVPLSELDRAATEVTHRLPSFLPDGRHFLYTARSEILRKPGSMWTASTPNLASKTRREVLAAAFQRGLRAITPRQFGRRKARLLAFHAGEHA